MNKIRTLGVLVCLAFALVFPVLFSNPAVTTIAVFTLILALAATGWNIFSGYTRYISLGHAAFYGLGAYILMVVCQVWNVPGGFPPLFLLPVVGLMTGICAFPLGWVALKTNHYTFIAITIAIFTIVAQVPNLLNGMTTGLSQLSLPIPLWSGDVYNLPFYYSALVLLLLALGVSWWIRGSKYGLGLLAIRDDEARTQGLGVKVGSFKLAAFIISAIFVGMAGALSAYFISLISPTSAFDTSLNIAIPLIAISGGSATLCGPIIGALIVVPVQQYLTLQFGAQNWDLILYGFLFLLVIRLLPDGILPALLRYWSAWRTSPGWMRTVEALPFISDDVSVAAPERSEPPAPQVVVAYSVAPVEQPNEVVEAIPHHHTEWSAHRGLTHKVRAQRLVSLPQGAPASSHSSMPIPPTGQPCPRCREPLWTWGDTRFCVRCGLTLSPARGKQSSTVQEGYIREW
jgi:branched-chain amino acid transport system permease protein